MTFTEAAPAGEEGDCPSDGCSTDAWDEAPELKSDAAPEDDASKQARHAREARRTRGYQSDRHSTEAAHERLNSQLAGLHRKKVIRARAAGEEETVSRTSAARRSGDEHEVRDETNAARFYGGVGLQLEESTPERFLRLAKLAREASISYATLAMATDYDCWHEGHDDVTVDQVIAVLQANVNLAKRIVAAAVPLIAAHDGPAPHHEALKGALLTPKDAIDPDRRAALAPLIGHVFS